MSYDDPILDRITYVASPAPMAPIPWPKGLGPNPPSSVPEKLPQADVLAVTWTAAEARALADVLTPGHASNTWKRYTEEWSRYEHQLTGRSPARFSKCLGLWALTEIDGKRVVLFKSDLHLATDAKSLPIRQLWAQLLAAVKPKLVITTGTAGGIGTQTQLGDVCVTNGAKFNCQESFKAEPFAQQTFKGRPWKAGKQLKASGKLLAVNASKLRPVADRDPAISIAIGKPGVETIDFFGFADATDSYDVAKNDPDARNEEMDDATLPLALGDIKSPIPWLSIRNASDPQVPHMQSLKAEKAWAEQIYEKYGYWTTVCSAIACWAVIADL
jgi:nucleoside phosphorylase